jgi:hypothetical protein
MRRGLNLLLWSCVFSVGLAACNRYGDDIDAVQTAESVVPGKTNQVLAIDIAGARGTVEWQAGAAPQYESNDIVGVQAVIKRVSATGNRHQIELDFIHNRQTKKVAFDGALVDGKKQDVLSGALNLFMMQLE